jgi:hypothetical protein
MAKAASETARLFIDINEVNRRNQKMMRAVTSSS